MKAPCVDCICLAICKHKRLFQLRSCTTMTEYVKNPWKHGGFVEDNIKKINEVLNRRLYIALGSYGYEFLRDLDDPEWVTKKMKNYMGRRAEEKDK